MKTQHCGLTVSISKEHLKEMTTMVRETIAATSERERKLSSAELWNIQRRKKNISPRRNSF